ncbi:MAG TPA: acyl-CoA dehydrogenase family protein [Alphaproteobacteria bacterium]|nr:acyl-CoA dehydrogenase family protein [Alphaproteobacteria bacterium]
MSEVADLLLDTAERLFANHCDRATLARAEAGIWPEALWAALEEAGFPKALVPEAAGGTGVGAADALGLVRSAAKFSAPVPLAETMLAARVLAEAGLAVPEGPLAIAPVNRRERFTLSRQSGGWRLAGRASRVPWARHATALVLLVEEGNRPMAVSLAAGRAEIKHGANLAGEPRDDVALEADVTADAVAPLEGGIDLEQLYALGAALRTNQIAGALARALEITVRYAGERVQFGRPIGKFQAVQQNLAVLAGQAAAAAAAADIAAEAVGTAMSPLAIASAKVRAGEAAGLGAAIAHQVHGAIGFTEEYALQLSTRRLWSWREEFGNEAEWAAVIGRHAAAQGADRLWATITGI